MCFCLPVYMYHMALVLVPLLHALKSLSRADSQPQYIHIQHVAPLVRAAL